MKHKSNVRCPNGCPNAWEIDMQTVTREWVVCCRTCGYS